MTKYLIRMILLAFTASSVLFLWFALSTISRANTVLVTTAQDELDVGSTLTNPLGTGLSLREAISLMSTEDTANYVINFASNVSVISLASTLPEFSTTCGTQTCVASLVGDNVTLVGTGGFDALSISVDGVSVEGLNFKNFRHAIVTNADNISLENLIIEDSTQSQIQLGSQSTNIHITESTIRSGDASGIEMLSGADTGSWQKLKIYDNAANSIVLASDANAGILPPLFSATAFFPGSDGKIVVTGSGSQNGTIEFYLSDGETYLGKGTVDGSGHFSVTLPTSESETNNLPASGSVIAFQTTNNRSSAFSPVVPFMPFDLAGSVTVDAGDIAPQETANFQVILTNPLSVVLEKVAVEADFSGLPPLTLGQVQSSDHGAVLTSGAAMIQVSNITIQAGNVVTITIPVKAGAAEKNKSYQPKIRITAPQEKILSVPTVIVENVAPQVTITPATTTVSSGSGVTLTGIATDPNGDQLSESWTVISGTPALTLNSTDQLTTSFTAPQVTTETVYTLKLKVDDGTISSEAIATVTVKVGNLPPVIAPTDIPVVRAGKEVKLIAQASDPNNDHLTYIWKQTSGSGSIAFTGSAGNAITFIAPKLLTTTKYGFSVDVSDGKTSVSSTAYVIVKQYRSESPTADAGSDQTVSSAATVTLDASKSKDADSLVLTYLWEQTDGPKVTFTPTIIKTTFTAPTVTQDTILEFKVTVKDGVNDATDVVRVLVLPKGKATPSPTAATPIPNSVSPSTSTASSPPAPNLPPAVVIEAPSTASPGQTIDLNGSTTHDPEGKKMRYFWRVTNQTLAITNFDKAKASLKIPADFKNNTKVLIELAVNDDKQQAKKTHEILVKGSAPAVPTPSKSALTSAVAQNSPLPIPNSDSPIPNSPSVSTLKRSDVIAQAQKACFPSDPIDPDQKTYLDKAFLDIHSQNLDIVGITKIDAVRDVLTACQVFPWKKRNEITTKDKESGFTDIPAVDNTSSNYWWARYARFSREYKLFKDKDTTFEPTKPLTQEDLDGLLRKIQKLLDSDYQYLPFYSSLKTLKIKLDSKAVDGNNNNIPDFWEKKHGKDPKSFVALDDSDSDGLTNYQEYIFDTDPYKSDTDGDDIEDGREVFLMHTDPVRFDTDSDGISDYTELFVLDSNPREADSDGDKFFDRFEGQDTSPTDDKSMPKDENSNGLPDDAEQKKNISYTEDDDADGLSDAWEYYQGTDGKKKDNDGDKSSDADEILNNDTNPKDADSKPQKDTFKIVNLGSHIITSGQSLLVQAITSRKQDIHFIAITSDGKFQEMAKGAPNKQGLVTVVLTDIPVNTIALVATDNESAQMTDRSPLVFVQVKQVDLAAPTIVRMNTQEAHDKMKIDTDTPQIAGEAAPGVEIRLTWQSTTFNAALLSDGKSGEFISHLTQALEPGEHTLYAVAVGPHGERSSVTQMHLTYDAPKNAPEGKSTQAKETSNADGFLASVFGFGAKPQFLITAIMLLVSIFCIRMGFKQRKQKLIAELVEEQKQSQLTAITLPNNDSNEQ